MSDDATRERVAAALGLKLSEPIKDQGEAGRDSLKPDQPRTDSFDPRGPAVETSTAGLGLSEPIKDQGEAGRDSLKPDQPRTDSFDPRGPAVETSTAAEDETYIELGSRPVVASIMLQDFIETTPDEDEPELLADVEALPPPVDHRRSAVPLEPLFLPRWTRGILTAALSIRSQDGAVDVERVVDHLARARAILRVPRHSLPTTRYGVQLLVDMGAGMIPFVGDRARLQADIVRILGPDRSEVLRFAGCPSRGAGPRSQRTWGVYRPPQPGTPVAVISDLGIGEPPFSPDSASVAEWRAYADSVRRAGCPMVAFVPYPLARVPVGLRRAMAVIPWDRSTTAGVVRSLIGLGLEVP